MGEGLWVLRRGEVAARGERESEGERVRDLGVRDRERVREWLDDRLPELEWRERMRERELERDLLRLRRGERSSEE